MEQKRKKNNKMLLQGLKNLRLGLNELSVDEFVISTIEMLMITERDEYLDQIKSKGGKDKGNGHYPRSFKSFSKNSLVINIPRTRLGEFKPVAIEFLKHRQESINELVLKLYVKGLTTTDVSDILESFFGTNMSPAQVCKLSEAFSDIRAAWEKSFLEKSYKVAFCDALYMTVRRGDSYSKEAVHVIYGIREDNKRELLHLSINPTESRLSWREAFQNIKKRGIQSIDLIIADGVKGLQDEVHTIFPGTKFQKCVVHKRRNITNKVRPKEKAQIQQELKEVFNNFEANSSKEEGIKKFKSFVERWQDKYPSFKNQIDDNLEYYFTYVDYPYKLRRMIYSTNSIENLNKMIRKATKNKLSFEKPERLLDYVFMVIKQFEDNNWMKYPITAMQEWRA